MGQNPPVSDSWGIDAAIGAAAVVARTAGGVTRGVLGSAPGKVAMGVAEFATRPLAEQGRALSHEAAEDGAPGLTDVIRQVTPGVVDAIGINGILEQIDVDALIDRVDVDKIVARVDVDKIVARVDIDALLKRVDINAIVQRLDMDQLMSSTELGGIIAQSTSGVATQALDSVRSQGVGLDGFINRWANRLVRRDVRALPTGPPLLVDPPKALPPAASDAS